MRLNSTRTWTLIFYSSAAAILVLFSLGLILAQTPPTSPATSTQPAQPMAPASAAPTSPPRPLVIIDPAHGGSESGAVLNPTILEKDVTLSLARRLRQDLTSRGILVELVRDADVSLSTDDRAAKANAEHPLLYLCLHVSSEVGGLRIFSALTPETTDSHGPFVDWNSAQSASLATSRAAGQQLVTAIQKSGLAARSLMASLRPLNSIATPALAVEVGPATADVSKLTSADYQQTISTALANGVATLIPALQAYAGASR